MADRQETGGPNRTPRSEITAAVPPGQEREPTLLLDLSTSTEWEAAPNASTWNQGSKSGGRRGIMIQALRPLVMALENQDSQMTGEQAGGDTEKGGVLAFGFANDAVEIGDLNSANLESRLNAIQWGGRTNIMPAYNLAVEDYNGEFGDRSPQDRPVHEIVVLTDGEADDWDQFSEVLRNANQHRVFAVAIIGYGEAHDKTVAAYQQAAIDNQKADKFGKSHVKVVSFDEVTDPTVIAEDLITLVG